MIDLLSLAVPHFVMAIAVWRLMQRTDLDDDPALPGSDRLRERAKAGPARDAQP